MNFTHTLIVMFIGSFIIQYYLMSLVMSNTFYNVTNSFGKLYLSIIMGLFMILLEVLMHDSSYNVLSYKYYIAVGLLLFAFIYFYRQQVYIFDEQYIKEMIEHHSMALLTSNKILEKTNNYHVAKLAKNIIQNQTDEINIMRNILHKI